MNVLSAVFTSTENARFFENFFKSYLEAEKNMRGVKNNGLLVVDFSSGNSVIQDKIEEIRKTSTNFNLIYYRHIPNNGFCDNFDYTIKFSKELEPDCVFFFNDDIIISDVFMKNGVDSFKTSYNTDTAHFIGGVPQLGGWMEEIENMKMPKSIDKIQFINPYKRLNWEFSACVFRTEVLYRIGYMDKMYSSKIGLNADNDYLIRMQRKNYRCIRDYSMRFLHSKAATQGRIRDAWKIMNGTDVHTLRAMNYLRLKWGFDTDPTKNYEPYKIPFNGKKCEVLDINTIKIGDEIIKLPEVI